MIKEFLKERLGWILFFLFLQILVLLMGYLDVSIPIQSVFYVIFLSSLAFLIFVFIRYSIETRYYKDLNNHPDTLDLTAIPDANSPFEMLVSDRLNEQMETSKARLDTLQIETEQEKDDILNWIHEVKTPLTTMQLMIDRVPDKHLRWQIMYEWLRIHLLLDQQLHQKRIPFIQNDLYIEQTDLQKVMVQEIKSLKLWCVQKGIGFDVDLQAEEVLSDAKWLGFLIRQLLTNAVKYSEASDIRIRSWMDEEVGRLSIEDSGRGIDAKDLPRIFDKGFTGTEYHQDHAATGMGLYLVKQVAESLHVDIQAESTAGVGTIFTVTFPTKNELVRITGM